MMDKKKEPCEFCGAPPGWRIPPQPVMDGELRFYAWLGGFGTLLIGLICMLTFRHCQLEGQGISQIYTECMRKSAIPSDCRYILGRDVPESHRDRIRPNHTDPQSQPQPQPSQTPQAKPGFWD